MDKDNRTMRERLEGGRFEFHTATACTVTVDILGVTVDGFAWGERYALTANHSADRARHGELVYVNLATCLSISDVGEA